MSKNKQLARNEFLNFILNEKPIIFQDDVLTTKRWEIYLLTTINGVFLHTDFYQALEHLKELKFAGDIFQGLCYQYSTCNPQIDVWKII
ncbi:MAG: hypothetical protein ACK5AY_03435 [Bacteroidota bacterium]|jgi:hypothetical protein